MWNAVRDFKDYVSIGICKAFLYFKMHSDHRSTKICIKWMVYMVLKNKSMMVDYGLRICGQVHVNLLHTFQWPRKYTHSPWRVFLHLRFMCFLGEGNCRRIPWLLLWALGNTSQDHQEQSWMVSEELRFLQMWSSTSHSLLIQTCWLWKKKILYLF